MSTKTIAIVGITGNQGSSVANVFLNEPGWHVRGITRDPSKPSSKTWTDKGVELVAGDLDDLSTLRAAFANADVIFGVTDFWQHMKDPAVHKLAAERNITPNEIAYEREVAQGRSIVDAAAANVETIERFVLSTVNSSKEWSKGKITFNLHFDAKWVAVEYCREKYPELWKKTSLLQLGVFASNWKQGMVPKKQDDGTYKLSVPMGADRKLPMVDPNEDTGHFVKALVALPPGKNLMGAGSYLTWNEWLAMWSRHNNVTATFERQDPKELEQYMGTAGRELADMWQYIDEFGYDGADPSVVYPWDLGVDVKYTTMEEYIKRQDWSEAL